MMHTLSQHGTKICKDSFLSPLEIWGGERVKSLSSDLVLQVVF